MPPRIRRGVRADAAALAAIGRRVFPHAHVDALTPRDEAAALETLMAPDRFERELEDATCRYWVAEFEDAPAANRRWLAIKKHGDVKLTGKMQINYSVRRIKKIGLMNYFVLIIKMDTEIMVLGRQPMKGSYSKMNYD